jgi:signal transduction histidine kinase
VTDRRSRVALAPLAGTIVVTGVVLFLAHQREKSLYFYDAGNLPEFSTFELTGAAAFLGIGATVLRHSGSRRQAAVLFLLGLCLVPVALCAPSFDPAPPPAGAALGLTFLVVTAVLVLAHPAGRLGTPYRWVVAVLAAGLVVAPTVRVVLGLPGPAPAAIELAAAGVLVVAILARLRSLRGLQRQALAPLALVTLVLAGASAAVVALADRPVPPWEYPLGQQVVALNVQAVALAMIPLALLAETLRRRWAAASVYEQVGRALGDRDPAILVAALRRGLGDPQATVWLAGRDEQDWFDAAAVPAELPPGCAAAPADLPPVSAGRHRELVADAGGNRLGLLDLAATDDRRLLDAILPAVRVGLENASLDARIRRHTAELENSRRRIVEAIAHQRTDLRRELVEGPRTELEIVRDRLAGARLADARRHLGRGLAGVREVARGVYPPVLTQSGLVAALGALREQAAVPIDLTVDPAVPGAGLRTAVESTAYFVVADCVRHAERRCRVDLRIADRHLSIEVAGAAGPMQAAQDRVEALGGTVRVAGDRVTASIPLAGDR